MKNTVFLRTPYNYDVDAVSSLTGLECKDLSLAQQHMKNECDINNIVEQFGVTGQLPAGSVVAPTYGDFTGINDYRAALDAVMAADDAFMALPANLRERFNHDPAELVDFVSDINNRSEAIDLGLIPPPAKPDGVIPSPEVAKPAAEA
jgi:phage internal scaffolding protein